MSLLDHYGYLIIFAVLALEGTGMPGVPLEIVFLGAGYFIQDGRMSFALAVASAALGNVAGNLIGYFVGAAGRSLVISEDDEDRAARRAPGAENACRRRRRLLSPKNLAMVKKWFARYGAFTVFIGRWFGPIRTPAILASGLMSLDIRKYLAASLLGASTWCFVWQLAAWKLGAGALRFLRPCTYLAIFRSQAGFWLPGVIILMPAGYLLWRRMRQRNGPI